MRPEWEEIESRRRRTESGSRAIFGIAGVVAAAFLLWTYVLGGKLDLPTREPMQGAVERVAPVPITPRPAAPAPSADQQPHRANQGRQTDVGVYECVVNGQRVVSDKPCGPGAQARVLEVDQPDPRNAALLRQQIWTAQQATGSPPMARPSTYGAPPAAPQQANANDAACRNIDQQIEQVDARMRQGYTSQEGEWYRERLRRLKERRYELGCGR